MLAEHLKELSDLKLDFSLEDTGFEMGEIDLRIEGLGEAAKDEGEVEGPVMQPTRPAVTRFGDVRELGRHRIVCGSALDESAFSTLLGAEKAGMVFTDPPYNVSIEGHVSGLGAIHHREFKMASGEMTEAQFTEFLSHTMKNLARCSREGSIHFICMDWRHASELLTTGRESYTELKNICVWAKSNAGMGSLYRSQHEFVFVFKNGAQTHRNNVQLGQFGRNRTNVWSYPGANSFGRGGEEGNLLALHPTVKPVALVADAILDVSARGDIALGVRPSKREVSAVGTRVDVHQ